MIIDTTFNMYSDANGGDPDSTSQTLRRYHKHLWSKPLPNGKLFDLTDTRKNSYLYHNSDLGEFHMTSDAITHSYRGVIRKLAITEQIPDDVNELFDAGSTIGAYIIFPGWVVDRKPTINGARGMHPYIDDRFDLTLECIRRFYIGEHSPLFEALNRYKSFFVLFGSFVDYVKFFLLDDLINEQQRVKFYLPFSEFTARPTIANVDEYLIYKNGMMEFITARNKRMDLLFNPLQH